MAITRGFLENPKLRHLDLSNNPLTHQGPAVNDMLKTCVSLESLNLEGCKLTAKDAAVFADSLETQSSLLSLNLGTNDLGTKGGKSVVKALTNNTKTKLESLDLSQTLIGMTSREEPAMGYIEGFLSTNKTLRTLNLGKNKLTNCLKSLIMGLSLNSTLYSLYLNNSQINIKDVFDLLKVNQTLLVINLENNREIDESREAHYILVSDIQYQLEQRRAKAEMFEFLKATHSVIGRDSAVFNIFTQSAIRAPRLLDLIAEFQGSKTNNKPERQTAGFIPALDPKNSLARK